MSYITPDGAQRRLRRDAHIAARRALRDERNRPSSYAMVRWRTSRDLAPLAHAMLASIHAHDIGVRRRDVKRDAKALLGSEPTDEEMTTVMSALRKEGLVRVADQLAYPTAACDRRKRLARVEAALGGGA